MFILYICKSNGSYYTLHNIYIYIYLNSGNLLHWKKPLSPLHAAPVKFEKVKLTWNCRSSALRDEPAPSKRKGSWCFKASQLWEVGLGPRNCNMPHVNEGSFKFRQLAALKEASFSTPCCTCQVWEGQADLKLSQLCAAGWVGSIQRKGSWCFKASQLSTLLRRAYSEEQQKEKAANIGALRAVRFLIMKLGIQTHL